MPTLGNEKRGSLDPMFQKQAGDGTPTWESGKLLLVSSPEQFDEIVETHRERLVVLMCKSHSCRPCKMFTRKYMSIAQRFPEVVCCELYGDETPETRKMMIRLQVKVTPTFRMYRQHESVNVVTGTNDKKLMRGILAQLFPAELVNHEAEIQDTLESDEELQAAAATAAAAASH
uniref:Thioredoxin domain-containing protein n=1 Tax=Tetradesmus obliquus TaxID=3088 RepID=A0A383VHJ7_TETOB|eukprot:jgi/Sobl393_1/18785/SZX79093.1